MSTLYHNREKIDTTAELEKETDGYQILVQGETIPMELCYCTREELAREVATTYQRVQEYIRLASSITQITDNFYLDGEIPAHKSQAWNEIIEPEKVVVAGVAIEFRNRNNLLWLAKTGIDRVTMLEDVVVKMESEVSKWFTNSNPDRDISEEEAESATSRGL